MKIYDYIIVGAGPSGLALSWFLGQKNQVLLIDKEETIGGCHRVRRVSNLFTEHGPRIYSSAYRNSIIWLKQMGIDFFKEFTPYNFSISTIGGESIRDIGGRELGLLVVEFFKLVFNENHGKRVSCLEFMERKGFSQKAKEYIDRLCRLTDGVGADGYTLFELLQTINQNFFYQIYQPKRPMDQGVLNLIQKKLAERVDIRLGTKVESVGKNHIVVDNSLILIRAKNIIFAIPPENMAAILGRSPISDAFGSYPELIKQIEQNRYNEYLSMTFHWFDKKIDGTKVWGFPKSAWGIAWITLSDYMEISGTLISLCITITDVSSPHIGKLPGECTEGELIQESFRQLRLALPNLPDPDESILSPGVNRVGGNWISEDRAYMQTKHQWYLPFTSPKYPSIHTVGTHNGMTDYHFTSMESAVTNAMKFCGIETEKPIGITDVIRVIIFLLFILVIKKLIF